MIQSGKMYTARWRSGHLGGILAHHLCNDIQLSLQFIPICEQVHAATEHEYIFWGGHLGYLKMKTNNSSIIHSNKAGQHFS